MQKKHEPSENDCARYAKSRSHEQNRLQEQKREGRDSRAQSRAHERRMLTHISSHYTRKKKIKSKNSWLKQYYRFSAEVKQTSLPFLPRKKVKLKFPGSASASLTASLQCGHCLHLGFLLEALYCAVMSDAQPNWTHTKPSVSTTRFC